ncbi:MAG: heat-inducible transcriptional repressor HrcA [Pseudobdellovibrionaceae bacterium]
MSFTDNRSRDIFCLIVEEYLKYGFPVGSRTISKSLSVSLSPATIRNVMADLEESELIFSPHTSAGRQPTELGLRLYVDNLMKIDDIGEERSRIDRRLIPENQSLTQVYEGASAMLSGLSSCVGLVIAPKMNKPIRKIEFLKMEPRKILAILITQDGMVENRMFVLDQDVSQPELQQATNFLNDLIAGKTLGEINTMLGQDIQHHQDNLSRLASILMKEGIIDPLSSLEDGHIFINGQSRLFDDPQAQERLQEIRDLFDILDQKQSFLDIMSAVQQGEGVQIFIGSENHMFERPAWSTIIKAYKDQNGRIIGATGVIGPTRLNYGKIVPIVDYTSAILEKLYSSTSPY